MTSLLLGFGRLLSTVPLGAVHPQERWKADGVSRVVKG